MLYLIQIIAICNALILGYNVKKIGVNKYKLILKKTAAQNIQNMQNDNFEELINNIISFNMISNV
jgi:hypothetical protein